LRRTTTDLHSLKHMAMPKEPRALAQGTRTLARAIDRRL
jgi:hypothetical protein